MSVVGARPNFMKIAPFVKALRRRGGTVEHLLVHTGQHYDNAMSDVFFQTLGIPEPDAHLEVGSGSHAEQVGRTMIAFEPVLRQTKPDWVVVVGDVNATCACAITAKKECIKLAHVEAGLRSFDMRMPEEINRLVTDRLSDLLLTPDAIADANLRNEGAANERIRRVGNIMIDTLDENLPRAQTLDTAAIVRQNALDGSTTPETLRQDGFGVVTLHRPSNVDERETLEPLVRFLADEATAAMPLVWTLHPRTRKQLEAYGLWKTLATNRRIALVGPLGYLEMLRLNVDCRVMLTDSGGLQEECCVLGTPCVTLRENTERPITLRENGGVSELAGQDVAQIRQVFRRLAQIPRSPFRPPLWDGHTAERIVEALV